MFFLILKHSLLFFLIKKVTKKSRQTELLRWFCHGPRTSFQNYWLQSISVIVTFLYMLSHFSYVNFSDLMALCIVHTAGAAFFA